MLEQQVGEARAREPGELGHNRQRRYEVNLELLRNTVNPTDPAVTVKVDQGAGHRTSIEVAGSRSG